MTERWLTYEQAGELLGVSAEAARQRALRLHWRKQKDNHGRALILVPVDANAQTGVRPPVQTPTANTPENSALVKVLEARVEELRELLEKAQNDADLARGEANDARGDLKEARKEWGERLDKLAANLGEAQEARTAAEAEARRVQDALAAEQERRAAAEEETRRLKARGWWARLRRQGEADV